MSPDVAALLWDARQAIERVTRFVATKTLADYRDDDLLRSAVERQLEILGEALSRARKLDESLVQRLPDMNRAIGVRNILAHAYGTVDDTLIWGIATERLESFQVRLSELLDSAP